MRSIKLNIVLALLVTATAYAQPPAPAQTARFANVQVHPGETIQAFLGISNGVSPNPLDTSQCFEIILTFSNHVPVRIEAEDYCLPNERMNNLGLYLNPYLPEGTYHFAVTVNSYTHANWSATITGYKTGQNEPYVKIQPDIH